MALPVALRVRSAWVPCKREFIAHTASRRTVACSGLDLAGNIQWYAANWLVVHRRTKAGYAQDQQALVLVVTDPLLRSAPDQAGAPQPIRAGGVRDDKDVGTESA